jgi:hypothetical protein
MEEEGLKKETGMVFCCEPCETGHFKSLDRFW